MNNALEAFIPVVAIVFTFGIPGVLLFWWIYTKHREKMRLIEKGLSPEEVKAYFADNTKPKNPYASLKFGLVLLFLGFGIFLANVAESIYDVEEGVMMGIIVTFIGLGFLIYFLVVNSKNKNETTLNQ
ncbi:MAG TPA: DUF6249 domain-containing protein [Ignavibacteria bacterium]|nr:DUF6249 domain-containing protein [Ignavibacteria bacterium]HQY52191.1 DUF6249 domain-containing protein [Ignavibacteria bacterium]HRA98849.1 DUF6249 domain-containing protein [Ignavibacteria bacterium]